jgi:hypothetical protein
MITSHGSPVGATILAPRDMQRLRQACPDLDNWPRSWRYDGDDIAVGQQIVEALTPFLLDLLDHRLAAKTVSRHRDNLWVLGGELVRRRHEHSDLARQDVTSAIQQLIADDGGPLIYPRISESQQDSLDATCRKLHRFMRDSKSTMHAVGAAKRTHK